MVGEAVFRDEKLFLDVTNLSSRMRLGDRIVGMGP